MKKLVIVLLAVFFLAPSVWAEHRELVEKENKISTLMLIRNDWLKTDGRKNFHCQEFFGHWLWDKKIGGGIVVATTPETDYFSVKPFATMKVGPVHLVGGAVTTSGSDYVHGGIWFFPKIDQWKIFIDIRNYVEISGKGSDYLDAFLEATFPVIPEKISLGAAGSYDRWWQDDNHDWFLIGPIGYYYFIKEFAIFLRPSYEWDQNNGDTTGTAKFRVGFKANF